MIFAPSLLPREAIKAGIGLLLALAIVPATPHGALAQSARVTGVSTVRYISVRPLRVDSIAPGDMVGDSLFGRTPDGFPVRCVPGADHCFYFRPDDVTATIPFLNDLTFAAWGFGRGLQFRGRFFLRTGLEGDPRIWPRADDPVDMVELYLDWGRPWGNVRVGRQARTSGLGYYNYDGASISLRALRGLVVDAFAGWSLARGLNEPRTSGSLAAIEPYAPEKRGLIFGTGVAYRPSARGGVSALYQREIQDDREALYSERIALAANYRWTWLDLDASLDGDVALRELNHARVQGVARSGRGLNLDVFARRYRPFFELWTIWGAFSPVAFTEGGAGLTWRPEPSVVELRLHGAYRSYDETDASTSFGSVRDTGWRAGAVLNLDLTSAWQVQASYAGDVNPGAARSEGGIHVQYLGSWKGHLGGGLRISQLAYEYKINEGFLLGSNLDAGVRVSDRIYVSGGVQGYWHSGTGSAPEVDWNQIRATLRLDWTLGTEPTSPSTPPLPIRTIGEGGS
jgi:hypothetical protein